MIRPCSLLTLAPESDALLLVCLADPIVAVSVHIVTGVPVMQVHISRAMGVGAGTELWQVT